MVSTTHLDEIVEEDPSLAGRSFRPAPEQVAAVNADDGAALRRPLDERGGGRLTVRAGCGGARMSEPQQPTMQL